MANVIEDNTVDLDNEISSVIPDANSKSPSPTNLPAKLPQIIPNLTSNIKSEVEVKPLPPREVKIELPKDNTVNLKLEYSSVIPSSANLPPKETAKSLFILKQS